MADPKKNETAEERAKREQEEANKSGQGSQPNPQGSTGQEQNFGQ